jgi:hypothetical protein
VEGAVTWKLGCWVSSSNVSAMLALGRRSSCLRFLLALTGLGY